METNDKNEKVPRWLNTMLLSVVLAGGGFLGSFLVKEVIELGKTVSAISSAQVTRSEMETKVAATQAAVSATLANISTEQQAIRAKQTALEISVVQLAAKVNLKGVSE